jgi:hypothetical protein
MNQGLAEMQGFFHHGGKQKKLPKLKPLTMAPSPRQKPRHAWID